MKLRQKIKMMQKIIQEAIKDNFDCIIAVGGDGTLNECLNGIIGSNMSLGVYTLWFRKKFLDILG